MHPAATALPAARGVYVLELNGGGFYVGKSENVQARVQQHLAGVGSSRYCVARGGVKRVLSTLTPAQENLAGWEQSETLAQMRLRGVGNVRGFEWTTQVLKPTDYQTIRTLQLGTADLCRKCGGEGHFAAQCGTRRKQAWLQEIDALCQLGARSSLAASSAGFSASRSAAKSRTAFKRRAGCTAGARKRKQASAKNKAKTRPQKKAKTRPQKKAKTRPHKKAKTRPQKKAKTCRKACKRCGRHSHSAESCFANTRVDGAVLGDSEDSEDCDDADSEDSEDSEDTESEDMF